jgi:hypothetical protein
MSKTAKDMAELARRLKTCFPNPPNWCKGKRFMPSSALGKKLPVFIKDGQSYMVTYAKGTCPKCGNEGNFVQMALICPEHGAFGGC